tara:strand:- start:1112 stop:2962 length:1851 start_codon:yes stop_codon:yes gene_type:complete
MTSRIRKKQKLQRKNQYINKSYNDFRNELLDHATTYFSNQNRDFSPSSLGGMFLDFAAIVGDSLSFYVEQQFNELNPETATSTENIIKHLRNAGINSSNNSPSSLHVTFLIEVDVVSSTNPEPKSEFLPIIKEGTRLISDSGIEFTLVEDIDFSSGYESEPGDEDDNENITTLILSKKGLCISGQTTTESVKFPDTNQNNFLSYELENEDVTDILMVIDEDLNKYYEVEYLTQNTVYKKVDYSKDSYFEILPAIFRFTRETNFSNGRTVLRFGNGDGSVLKDNILDNPEDILLPLKQTDYFTNKSLDPNKLIKSNSLGVSPKGKRVQIRYRHGGGQDHNVPTETINEIIETKIIFPNLVDESSNLDKMTEVIESVDVINEEEAVGGSDSLSLDELKLQIPNALKAQSRIITHEDLIGRIYTMPTNFGRINKAAALDNPYSNGSKDLYVVCKDINNFYIPASDAVKNNLSKYLNEFRLIGDNFNILDVGIFNFGIKIEIRVSEGYDIDSVRTDLAFRIVENMRFDALQIGEPIDTNGLVNIALNTDGVVAISTNQKNMILSKTSANKFFDEDIDDTLSYNDNFFNPISSYEDGFIYPEPGGIFEMRYSANDIEIIVN